MKIVLFQIYPDTKVNASIYFRPLSTEAYGFIS